VARRGKPVIYGCGDFINDHEGITGYEAYRGDLCLMYFVQLDGSGDLNAFTMTPMQIRKLRLRMAPARDAEWLYHRMSRECVRLGTRVRQNVDKSLALVC